MAKKELYTREETMRWVLDFLWERIAEIKRGNSTTEYSVPYLRAMVDELNTEGILTKTCANVLQSMLEHYHSEWLNFYQAHYEGLALMNRTHDNLSYFYEAWYYFCRPGTYTI